MTQLAYRMDAEDFSFCDQKRPAHELASAAAFNLTDIRNIPVRVAVIGDMKAHGTMGWLHFIAPNQQICTVSESYVADLTGVREEYDILVVAGYDMRRLQRLLRLYQPVLTKKPKIAVLVGAMPSDRSKLLNSGYDDVFDQRTPVPEAQARLLAHHRRYRMSAETGSPRRARSFDPSLWCDSPLTARENEILAALAEKSPLPVLTYHLRKSQSGKRELANSSVRVLISTIRSKLKPGITISYAGCAYSIERSNP
ncbi:hypothetical protein NVSP9465_00865 [Novosphingobium sp. CECT 9465]|nr:hypothetical protein NVSP9465_00865 [Novosphingobium sp. CECT 9465]